jgi:hypothetical protein
MVQALTQIPVSLDDDALMRHAHVEPHSEDAADFLKLLDRAREAARPKVLFAESFVDARGEDTVRIDGATFTSRMLRENLAQVERVFPYVATCGHEMDLVPPPKDDFVQAYWWDVIKGAVLGNAYAHFHDYLKRTFVLTKVARMNPGSGDADIWPIKQQPLLFALLGNVRELIGVELTPTFLMVPNKTTSGILFATEKDFRSCQVCRRENCTGRGAPFDAGLWDSIHATEQALTR